MPSMIECHDHVTAYMPTFAELARFSSTYVAAQAARIMGDARSRLHVSARRGGADFGLVRSPEEGLIRGPRLFFCGKALSLTGGHGDVRGLGFDAYDATYTQPGLGARLLQREHELGLVEPGYRADLILVDGNPLENIRVLTEPQRPPQLVPKGGAILVNRM